MTSSKTLKKILTIGAATLLAIGGTLGASAPANAADHSTVSLGGNSHIMPGMTSISLGLAGCTSYTGSPDLSDFAYTITPGTGSITGMFLAGYIGLSVSTLVDGQTITITYTKNANSAKQITCNGGAPGDTVGSFVFTDTASTPVTMTGPSGNVNGTVGSAMTMGTYVTTGMTSPVVYSYVINGGGSLPTGVTFDTTTGQLIGTPTVTATNVSVTVRATGTNSATATSTFTLNVTGGNGGGGGGGGGGGTPITVVSAPSYSISGSVATANDGTWSAAGTINRFWILCDNPHTSAGTAPPMDCTPLALTQSGSDERGTTLALATTVWKGFSGARTQVNLADKYLGLYVSISNGLGSYVTATTAGSAPVAVIAQAPLSPLAALKLIKPLPVIVQPLVAALPALSKPMVDAGGKVALTAGDFTGLVSASISGKVLDITVGSTGGLTITVPNGQAGKTADLLLNFTSGTVILQDAIKYVAPVVVANVPVRPVAIKAGAKTLSPAAADSVRQAAFANLKNNSIECVGYASSAAGSAAAEATAQQACALAVKSNPDLVNTNVVVVIDLKKAATQGVGIKVYKK